MNVPPLLVVAGALFGGYQVWKYMNEKKIADLLLDNPPLAQDVSQMKKEGNIFTISLENRDPLIVKFSFEAKPKGVKTGINLAQSTKVGERVYIKEY